MVVFLVSCVVKLVLLADAQKRIRRVFVSMVGSSWGTSACDPVRAGVTMQFDKSQHVLRLDSGVATTGAALSPCQSSVVWGSYLFA